MTSLISKLPLGNLSGGAQDDVEMRLARDIRALEVSLGQPANTIDIPLFMAQQNERHALVPKEQESALAANVELLYPYAAAQVPLQISRAGYKSYQAGAVVETLKDSVDNLAAAAKGLLAKPQSA